MKKSFIIRLKQSFYSRKKYLWITIFLSFATLMLTLIDLAPPLIYIRWVLGFLYVLFIPGFTIVQVLFPKENEISPVERIGLGLGLSVAITPFIGYMLSYSGIGTEPVSVTVSFVVLSIFFATIALFRMK